MIRIATISSRTSEGLTEHVGNCLVALTARPDFDVCPSASIAEAPDADAYLLLGDDVRALAAQLEDAARSAASRLAATILMGVAPGFRSGSREIVPGTAVELLERFRLGGCFAPQALIAWAEAPSWFTGPKDLMDALNSNPFKAHQSSHYASWFVARGASLGDFLAAYVRAMARHGARQDV